MDYNILYNSWNYYLSIERDLANTSQYVEPHGQENVYSLEFAKLLILACTEVESMFKVLCKEIIGDSVSANMSSYKETILGKYPRIVEATVSVSRLGASIKPFASWNTGKLAWWGAYQQVKHDRGSCFEQATYRNAVEAVAALYILLLYLFKICENSEPNEHGIYLSSPYRALAVHCRAPQNLPDFEE